MTDDVNLLAWPAVRLAEALAALGSPVTPGDTGGPGVAAVPPFPEAKAAQRPWVEETAARAGWEAEAVEARPGELAAMLRTAAPLLVRLPAGPPAFLVVARADRRGLRLLSPSGGWASVPVELLAQVLAAPLEQEFAGAAERLAEAVCSAARARVQAAVSRALLGGRRVPGCWLLRPRRDAPALAHAGESRLFLPLALALAAQAAELGLWVASWLVLGRLSWQGQLDSGWLAAWALLLTTLVPCRLTVTWASGRLALAAGGMLRRRLLHGALQLPPDEVRRRGAGQLLGRVLEGAALESLALAGGLAAAGGLMGLAAAALVLGLGTGRLLPLAALAAWTVLGGVLARRYLRRRLAWTGQRLELTDGLVERMVGHRTRLAQEPREQWYAGDDESLARYLDRSAALDHSQARLLVLVPRGWFLLGLAALTPAFLAGEGQAAALAAGLGGVVLAYRAFRDLGEGTERLAAAWAAWRQVRPLWQAAARPEEPACTAAPPAHAPAVLEARALTYGHGGGRPLVLRGIDLAVEPGARLLVQGPSGGGKSTLAAVLAGLRPPTAGLVLLGGLDRPSLGLDGWRRRVVLAPQFHDNHVLLSTLAFNLLLARDWPAGEADLAEAERVCRGLGLGPLLERMPAGLMQMVGETGWQMSHGERSRLFLARAMLQGASIVILDESFAALDPGTLRQALTFVLAEAPALVVVAHP